MAEVTIVFRDDDENNAEDGLDTISILVHSDDSLPELLADATPAQQAANTALTAVSESSQVFERLPTDLDPVEIDRWHDDGGPLHPDEVVGDEHEPRGPDDL